MGKSVFRDRYVRPVRRVIAVDPLAEIELGGGVVTVDELEARVDELRSGVVRLVVRPDDWDDLRGAGGFLDRVCAAVLRIGNVLLVVEEVSFFAGASPSETPPQFTRCVAAGRHYGVSMCVVAQRWAMVPTVFRDNLSRIVAFRVPDPDSARELCKRLGGGVTPDEVQALEPHFFLDFTPDAGVRKCPPLPL